MIEGAIKKFAGVAGIAVGYILTIGGCAVFLIERLFAFHGGTRPSWSLIGLGYQAPATTNRGLDNLFQSLYQVEASYLMIGFGLVLLLGGSLSKAIGEDDIQEEQLTRAPEVTARRLAQARDRLKALQERARIPTECDCYLYELSADDCRQSVFAVEDRDLRMELMRACHECALAEAAKHEAESEIPRLRNVIPSYVLNERRQTWIILSIITSAYIVVGHFIGSPFDLIGLAVGLLWGIPQCIRADERIKRNFDALKRELSDALKEAQNYRYATPHFKSSEIDTSDKAYQSGLSTLRAGTMKTYDG
jgi:hypothetical protein